MTKEQLKEYCNAEFENIDIVVKEIFTVVSPEKLQYTVVELAAIATFMHNAYNGIEYIIKRVLLFDGLAVKDSPTWHKDLLEKAAELGILPPDLYQTLSTYLSFRHYFVHAYSFNLDWNELKVLVDSLENTLSQFKSEINDYIEII